MTSRQFQVIAKLIRSREPVRSAAYQVLVAGMSGAEAARQAGIKPQQVANTVRRFRVADLEIRAAYAGPD